MAGHRDTVAKFAQNDDWDRRACLAAKGLPHPGFSIHERGQRVGVQNHVRSSGSTTSKTASMLAWMRFVSLRASQRTEDCIHSARRRPPSLSGPSFSCNASHKLLERLALRGSRHGRTDKPRELGVVFTEPLPYLRSRPRVSGSHGGGQGLFRSGHERFPALVRDRLWRKLSLLRTARASSTCPA